MKMPKPSEGGDFTPVPEGLHLALCYQVIDLGTQTIEWQGTQKHQHKVLISWELPDERVETENGDRPAIMHNRYTLSSFEGAKLRQHLESWRGRGFSAAELDPDNPNGFDIKNLLGKACQINVVHNHKNDKTYANIASIVPKPKGYQEPATENPIVYFNMENGGDISVFNVLPDWAQSIIQKSPEWQERDTSQVPQKNGNGHFRDEEVPF